MVHCVVCAAGVHLGRGCRVLVGVMCVGILDASEQPAVAASLLPELEVYWNHIVFTTQKQLGGTAL
jgi:hypothetical protein